MSEGTSPGVNGARGIPLRELVRVPRLAAVGARIGLLGETAKGAALAPPPVTPPPVVPPVTTGPVGPRVGGQMYTDAGGFIGNAPGGAPLVIVASYAGTLRPTASPDRRCGGFRS